MPDATPTFRLPTPLQPASHHAIGMHNAPIFEYDLLEFTGEDGRPLIVIEPRRGDGKQQVPFSWFSGKVGGAVSETFGGKATVVVHNVTPDGVEHWLVMREVPVLDPADPEVQKIQQQAAAAGIKPEQALQHAVAVGALKPSDMRTVFAELKPASASEFLTELFSHHVSPAVRAGVPAIGFAAQAQRLDRAQAGAATPTPRGGRGLAA